MSAKAVRIALTALLLAAPFPISPDAQPTPPPGPAASPPAAPTPAPPAAPTPAQPAAPAPAQPAAPAPAPAAGAAPGAAAGIPAPAPAAPAPPAWLPRQTAELQIVAKMDATHRTLDVPVGGTAKVDTLVIQVKACVVRPPGEPRDAAAFLDITGKSAASPLFQGWMLAAEPAASVFEDPLYDVRVTGCR